MKHISLFKIFTLVCFLVVGTNIIAAEKTRESCERDVQKKANTDCLADKKKSSKPEDYDFNSCLAEKKAAAEDCSIYNSESECKTAKSDYTSARKKAAEDCSKLGVSLTECESKVRECSEETIGTGLGSSNMADSVVSIFSSLTAANTNPNANNSCYQSLLDSDDDFIKEDERIADKAADLEKDIDKLKDDANEEDNKLNEKRDKVAEEMQKLQQEFDDKKYERQTKNQEDANDLARKIIKSETEKRNKLLAIQKKNVEMANLAFAFQEIQLKYVDSEVAAKCLKERNALADSELYKLDKNGKKTAIQFDKKTARLKRNSILAKETSCLATEALKKSAEIKGLNDKKVDLKSEVDEINNQILDEDKSIKADQQAIADLKKISDEQEAKNIENLQKSLNRLNQSVLDLETYVTRKKQNIEKSILTIQKRIAELMAQKARVKSRYTKVIPSISEYGETARTANSICGEGTVNKKATETGFGSDGKGI